MPHRRTASEYSIAAPLTLTGMQIDHVTVAGSDLDLLRRAFAACGLEPAYGGPHANGVTHMASIGFRDGSYIELISFFRDPGPSRFWPEMIAGDAGACAWCVGVNDIAAESARLRTLGIPVEGPAAFARQRPDGREVAWDLSFAGEGSPGSLLPFFIQDRTPRSLRIEPSAALVESPIAGIGLILLAVNDLRAAVALFRRIWAGTLRQFSTIPGCRAAWPLSPAPRWYWYRPLRANLCAGHNGGGICLLPSASPPKISMPPAAACRSRRFRNGRSAKVCAASPGSGHQRLRSCGWRWFRSKARRP